MNFIAFFAALVATAHSRLSLEENQDRLEKCGKEEVWMWAHEDIDENWIIGAVPVSPRHFLTFSTLLLDWDSSGMEWRNNGTKFVANCGNGISSIEIPSDVLPLVKVTPPKDHSKPEWNELVPVKAYLLNFCDQAVKDAYDVSDAPLLIEVEKDLNVGFPCLMDTNVKVGDMVHAQSMDWGKILYETSVNITQLSGPQMFSTLIDVDEPPNQRGTILWKEANGVSMLIGANYYYILSTDETQNFYYFVPYFNNAMCEAGGICEPMPTTTTITTTEAPEPTTTTPTTTETPEPTTETLTTIETAKPTIETPTTRLPVPKKPSQPKKDEKKKEEVKKEENGKKEIGFELVLVIALSYLWK